MRTIIKKIGGVKKILVSLLICLSLIQTGVLAPVSFALAQCGSGGCSGGGGIDAGGLGSLLGLGSGGMLQILSTLLPMLLQLFQGGGTPQTGNAEEQSPYYGSTGPSKTGSQSGQGGNPYQGSNSDPYAFGNNGTGGNNATPTPTARPTLCSQTIFMAMDETAKILRPTAMSIKKSDCANFINGTNASQTIRVYKNGDKNTPTERLIDKESTNIFRFSNTGSYQFCAKNDINQAAVETCGTTVTITE